MLPKLVITDIDGVWTDGGMYYTEQGDVMKRFSVKDGWGVIFLRKLNIPVAIMTCLLYTSDAAVYKRQVVSWALRCRMLPSSVMM